MAATLELEQAQIVPVPRLGSPEDLSRRLGGLIVVEYLMNLFGASPKELFGRVDILAVLDGVKKDRTLFPEAVIAMSDRLNAKQTTRHATSPKALGARGRCKLPARD